MFKWCKLNFYRKITIWHRWNKKSKNYEFNHIENQWSNKSKPVGHPSWKSGIWLNLPGWLDYKNRVHIGSPGSPVFLIGIFITVGIMSIIWLLELIKIIK